MASPHRDSGIVGVLAVVLAVLVGFAMGSTYVWTKGKEIRVSYTRTDPTPVLSSQGALTNSPPIQIDPNIRIEPKVGPLWDDTHIQSIDLTDEGDIEVYDAEGQQIVTISRQAIILMEAENLSIDLTSKNVRRIAHHVR